jgi:hypothetical protein
LRLDDEKISHVWFQLMSTQPLRLFLMTRTREHGDFVGRKAVDTSSNLRVLSSEVTISSDMEESPSLYRSLLGEGPDSYRDRVK